MCNIYTHLMCFMLASSESGAHTCYVSFFLLFSFSDFQTSPNTSHHITLHGFIYSWNEKREYCAHFGKVHVRNSIPITGVSGDDTPVKRHKRLISTLITLPAWKNKENFWRTKRDYYFFSFWKTRHNFVSIKKNCNNGKYVRRGYHRRRVKKRDKPKKKK